MSRSSKFQHLARFIVGSTQLLVIAALIALAVSINGLIRQPSSTASVISKSDQTPAPMQIIQPALDTSALHVSVSGTVTVRTKTPIASEVIGRVAYVSDKFVTGGTVEAGDVLLRLDPADYEIQRRTALGELASARAALAKEEAEAAHAEEEWGLLFPDQTITPLAARKPQLDATQARVESAKAALDQAELAISRTIIKAPATGRILVASVARGQLVYANSILGELYDFDHVELSFPMPLETVRQFDPMTGQLIHLEGGHSLTAEITRIEGQLDTKTRLVTVFAQPQDLAALLPGEFLTGKLKLPIKEPLLQLPATALVDGTQVVINDSTGTRLEPVDIERREGETIYVRAFDYGDGILAEPNAVDWQSGLSKVAADAVVSLAAQSLRAD